MNRAEINKQYAFHPAPCAHLIASPGTFEGEPVWTPYFYRAMLDGHGTELETGECAIRIRDEDREEFPEIEAWMTHAICWEDDQGFVYCKLISRKTHVDG